METSWKSIISSREVKAAQTGETTYGCSISIVTMSVTLNLRKPKRSASDWQTQVSISNDHTLKSWMKGNFHVQFGIGGGESNLSADHTGINGKMKKQFVEPLYGYESQP